MGGREEGSREGPARPKGGTPSEDAEISGMVVLAPVQVFERLTEDLRSRLKREAEEEMEQLERQLKQLDFQEKRWSQELARRDPGRLPALRDRIEEERTARHNRQAELRVHLEKVDSLALGSLVRRGEVQRLVRVAPGTDWKRAGSSALILENGVVQEIRPGTGEGDD